MPIRIKQHELLATIGADSDWHPLAMCTDAYLSTRYGQIVLVQSSFWDPAVEAEFGRDALDDMVVSRELIDRNPDTFLHVPNMSHGDHHHLLQDFLASRWCDDSSLRALVRGVYFNRRSIGAWRKAVPAAAGEHFDRYRADAINRRAEEFLRHNGIDFQWK